MTDEFKFILFKLKKHILKIYIIQMIKEEDRIPAIMESLNKIYQIRTKPAYFGANIFRNFQCFRQPFAPGCSFNHGPVLPRVALHSPLLSGLSHGVRAAVPGVHDRALPADLGRDDAGAGEEVRL